MSSGAPCAALRGALASSCGLSKEDVYTAVRLAKKGYNGPEVGAARPSQCMFILRT